MTLVGLTALASYDSQTGEIRRYERCGDATLRLTHIACAGKGFNIEPRIMNAFRKGPPECFAAGFQPRIESLPPCA